MKDDFWTLLQQHNVVGWVPMIIILLGACYAFFSKVDLMSQRLLILEDNQRSYQRDMVDQNRRLIQIEVGQSVRGVTTLTITPRSTK